jgi:flagellar hook-length control protein FliK
VQEEARVAITQFGRVETDPNLVPVAAAGRPRHADHDAPFARELSRADAQPRPEPQARERAEPAPAPASEPAAERAPRAERREAAPAAGTATAAATAQRAGATLHQDLEAGGAERRISKGKATASPASLSPANSAANTATPLFTIASDTSAAAHPAAAAVPAGGLQPAAAVAGARSGAAATPAGSAQPAASRPQPLAPPAAGYRALDPRAARLAEAARDSIFKQIALRIGSESSQMRVLLQPPELGRLDLRVTVERNGALRVSIVADRADLAAMLERHAGELKQILSERGFADVQTHVQAGDSGGRWHGEAARGSGFDSSFADDADDEGADAPAALLRAGFTVGEGIDFWA